MVSAMTNPPPTPEDREARRRKLTGRAIVVGFGLLVLIYILATFVR
jgi:hypothetical protein